MKIMKRKITLFILAALLLWTASAVQAQVSVSTYAGSTAGYTDGSLSEAQFDQPQALLFDESGNLYVAENNNEAVRKITPEGTVSTLTTEKIYWPFQMTLADGKLYVMQRAISSYINQIDMTTGAVTITSYGSYNYSLGLCSDAAGNLYVSDYHSIYKVPTDTRQKTLLAGGGSESGFINGTGSAARFNYPGYMAIDASGNIYVTDGENHAIRKITPAGVVTTLAGSGTAGSADGTGAAASFNRPSGIAIGPDGHLYISESGNHTIRKITLPDGVVTTIAGIAGTSGNDNGSGASATFYTPRGLAFDAVGNLYVADYSNDQIRKITFTTTGVANAAADKEYSLTARKGEIAISSPSKINVQVYSLTGAAIYNSTLSAGSHTIPIKQGIYLVKVNGKAGKVVVR
ncbi:MAG: Serine/threonine-protein kinase PknD [Bacteroidetes bacterium ADurb.Bin174]|nr:MAG: Serine/threonine-protein kinase PknD [Bacteroidetes bacterium ADurb.Bin174]